MVQVAVMSPNEGGRQQFAGERDCDVVAGHARPGESRDHHCRPETAQRTDSARARAEQAENVRVALGPVTVLPADHADWRAA